MLGIFHVTSIDRCSTLIFIILQNSSRWMFILMFMNIDLKNIYIGAGLLFCMQNILIFKFLKKIFFCLLWTLRSETIRAWGKLTKFLFSSQHSIYSFSLCIAILFSNANLASKPLNLLNHFTMVSIFTGSNIEVPVYGAPHSLFHVTSIDRCST